MIWIRTAAYNAEDTLARTIDSILNQTYRNFTYYLMDNGSMDGTKNIIEEFAQKDDRIVPFYNRINHNYDENKSFWSLHQNIPQGDYLCFLDADDWYEPNFLEEMLLFVQQNDLDIAACGTWFVDAETGMVSSKRVLSEDVILKEQEDYERDFRTIYWNLRQPWGKLYTSRAANRGFEINAPKWFPRAYGKDTAFVLTCVADSEKIGVRACHLHNYWMHSTSHSFIWDDDRIHSDQILFQKAEEIVKQKCGVVSEDNYCFLFCVYFYAIKDTLMLLIRSSVPIIEKISNMEIILKHPITIEMLESDLTRSGISNETKETFVEQIFSVMLVNCKGRQRMRVLQLAQTIFAVLAEEESYIRYSKLVIGQYIRNGDYTQARIELGEWEKLLPGDKELSMYRKKLKM